MDNGNSNEEYKQMQHVCNRDQKHLSDHGQKLFNAINCYLNDDEQLELTQYLSNYQRDHNLFTLVRSCRQVFNTTRKKGLMLFMRPLIPIRDRFHYDEYHKLFFPDEFTTATTTTSSSIFKDLIPNDLVQKTIDKANARYEREKENECLKHIQLLEKIHMDLNSDLHKIKSQINSSQQQQEQEQNQLLTPPSPPKPPPPLATTSNKAIIGGFRIIKLKPNENESIGFDICIGPTNTFIMVSYVEQGSEADQLGMMIGDEIVSVNETSFKMLTMDEAYEYLSTQSQLEIVLQQSGFLPPPSPPSATTSCVSTAFVDWLSPFGTRLSQLDTASSLVAPQPRLIRRVHMQFSRKNKNKFKLGFCLRGGIENHLGVFVSRIKFGSNANLCGLHVGDQILSVNNVPFGRISVDDARKLILYNLFKYYKLSIRVRYTGRIPSMPSSNDVDLVRTIRLPSVRPSIEHKNPAHLSNKTDANFVHFCIVLYVKGTLAVDMLVHELYRHFGNLGTRDLAKDRIDLIERTVRPYVNNNDKDLISLNQLLVNLRLSELQIGQKTDGHMVMDDVHFYESLIRLESEENLSQIGSSTLNNEYHWKTIRKTNKEINALANLHAQCNATSNPNVSVTGIGTIFEASIGVTLTFLTV